MRTTILRYGLLPLITLVLASCVVSEQRPFDPRSLQNAERTAAAQLATPPMLPLPTTLPSPHVAAPTTAPSTRPAAGNEPDVRMTLQEIIHRAVANNLDVRVAGYSPAIDASRVIEAEARFDPTFFTNYQFQHKNTQTAGSLVTDPNNPFSSSAPVFFDKATVHTFQTGLRKYLESGGQVELRYQKAHSDLEPQRFVTNPYYEDDLTLQITQPLLQNFGNEVNRARILINRNTQKISLLDFRKTLEENLANVEQAYWQLVQAENDARIQQELLDRELQTYDILAARFKGGLDVTRLQTSQTQTSMEAHRAELVRSRARIRDLSDQLKRLMNDPTFPVTGSVLVLPQSAPVDVPLRFELKDQIDTAMECRLELAQQQIRVDNASITLKVARNNELPTLNVVGSVGTQGVSGSGHDASENAAEFSYVTYSVGFQFEVPIGNRAAHAITHRTRLQRQQAIDQYRSLIDQVAMEVKMAAREVGRAWDTIIATRRARFAAADAVQAIQERERAQEPLTPTFVQLKIDLLERLAAAESSEATAIADYNIAISRLERTKGTLLRYDNVLMEEAPIAK